MSTRLEELLELRKEMADITVLITHLERKLGETPAVRMLKLGVMDLTDEINLKIGRETK